MITLKEIILAINTKLEEILPNVKIQTTDISEGFERPSLFVDFEESTRADYNAVSIERNIPVVIYYFPSDRHKYRIELLEVQELLEDAFSGHFYIRPDFVVYPETTTEKVDGVLQCRFDIYFIQTKPDEPGELMESLEFNINKEE